MKLIVNGLLTQYSDEGGPQAPPILLLHGWGVSSSNFNELASQLALHYRVIRLDLPGFGSTDRPPQTWGVADYANFVKLFLEKIRVDNLRAVLGHSFGGRVIIKGLAHMLLPAESAILLDSAGLRPRATPRAQGIKLLAKTGRVVLSLPGLNTFAPAFKRRLYQSAGSEDYLDAGALRQIFLKVIAEDLSSDASLVTVPVLLIWGALDTDTPPSDGQALAKLIPDSRLEIIPSAGHFVHTDAPGKVCELIREFLNQ